MFSLQRITRYLILLTFGTVSFLGHAGLHALPGAPEHCGHLGCFHKAKTPSETKSATKPTTKSCGHSCCHHKHVAPKAVNSAAMTDRPTELASEDDCAICQVTSQTAMTLSALTLLVQPGTLESFSEAISSAWTAESLRAHLIRGPPALI